MTVSDSVVLKLFVAVAQHSGRGANEAIHYPSPSYSGEVVMFLFKVTI